MWMYWSRNATTPFLNGGLAETCDEQFDPVFTEQGITELWNPGKNDAWGAL